MSPAAWTRPLKSQVRSSSSLAFRNKNWTCWSNSWNLEIKRNWTTFLEHITIIKPSSQGYSAFSAQLNHKYEKLRRQIHSKRLVSFCSTIRSWFWETERQRMSVWLVIDWTILLTFWMLSKTSILPRPLLKVSRYCWTDSTRPKRKAKPPLVLH